MVPDRAIGFYPLVAGCALFATQHKLHIPCCVLQVHVFLHTNILHKFNPYKHACENWIFWPKSPHLGCAELPVSDLDSGIFNLQPLNAFSMLPSISPPQCKVGALFKPLLPLTHMQEKDLPMVLNSVEPSCMLQPQPNSHAKFQPQTGPSSNSLDNGDTL